MTDTTTHGPWHYSPDDPSQRYIYGPNGAYVAEVMGSDADARAIAALPALVEAARAALSIPAVAVALSQAGKLDALRAALAQIENGTPDD